jgi:hypothetical protein
MPCNEPCQRTAVAIVAPRAPGHWAAVGSQHERMSPDEVTKIVELEIGSVRSHSNAHGVDLLTCLLPPERRKFFDPMDDSNTFDLWLVLEEQPKTHGGYKIVFDEQRREFGRAISDQHGREIFLGFYGTFMETLDGM